MSGRESSGHRRPSLSRSPRHLRRLGQRRHPGPAAPLAGHSRPRSSRFSPATRFRPAAQLYVVGGGEDLPQALAARQLGRPLPVRWPEPSREVRRSWPCAPGCRSWASASWAPTASRPTAWVWLTASPGGARARAPSVRSWCEPERRLGLPPLSGYENHAGVTSVGPERPPSGRVRSGVGNGDGSGTDGVWAGRVFGTYLHGPVLARNPALADRCSGWAVGDLAPLDDRDQLALRAERLAAAGAAPHPGRAPSTATRVVGGGWWGADRDIGARHPRPCSPTATS